jgi:hypothetical protein
VRTAAILGVVRSSPAAEVAKFEECRSTF